MRLLPTLLLLVTAPALSASDWLQWRGPERDGTVTSADWPTSLDEGKLTQQWRVRLGPSYSGPIVSGDRVFTTETEERQNEVVHAYNRRTGELLWSTSWEGAMKVPFFAKANGDWIRATPASDGKHLYVAGMRDVLVCLNVEDGSEKWRLDFPAELDTPLPAFGFASSPLLHEGAVYVQAGAGLCKVDAASGKLLWRSLVDKGGMFGSAFSSPVVATLGGRKQLVVQTRERLAGVNIGDGQELWSQPVKAFRGMNILTPVVQDDSVYTSTYGGSTLQFRVAAEDSWKVSQTWSLKEEGYMSSPVVIDGVVYQHLRNQRLMAVDIQTGEKLWQSEERFGKYWSLVTNGKMLLALDQKGILRLIQPSREGYAEVSSREISDDPTWAHITLVDDQIFIREEEALTAWRWSAN